MAKPAIKEFTNEDIFQLLSQGTLLLMEDDLRVLQGEQVKNIKEKRTREHLKILPKENAPTAQQDQAQAVQPNKPSKEKKQGFFAGFKKRFIKEKAKEQKLTLPESFPSPVMPMENAAPKEREKPFPPEPQTPLETVPLEKEQAAVSPKVTLVKPTIAPAPAPTPYSPPVSPISPTLPTVSLPAQPIIAPSAVPSLSLIALKVEPFGVDSLKERINQVNELKLEIDDLDKKLQINVPQKNELKEQIRALQSEKQILAKALTPFLTKSAHVKALQKEVAEKESSAALPQERRNLEEQRWTLEQQRREAEQQQWQQEEKIERKAGQIKDVERELEKLLSQERAFQNRKDLIAEDLEKVELAKERISLTEKANNIDFKRRGLLREMSALNIGISALDKELLAVQETEKSLEAQEAALETFLEKLSSFQEKKETEQKRWGLGEKRRIQEQKRWEVEKKIQDLKEQVNVLGNSYGDVLQNQIDTEIRAEEIDVLMRHTFVKAQDIISQRKRQQAQLAALKKQEIEQRQETVKPITPAFAPQKPAAPYKREPVAAPSALVKGEVDFNIKPSQVAVEGVANQEITTAAKIKEKAREREIEKKLDFIAQKAQEQRASPKVVKIKGPISKADILRRLSQVSQEELIGREKFLARVSGKLSIEPVKTNGQSKEVVFRPLVKKSSVLQKVFARLFFILLVLAFLAGIYLIVRYYQTRPALQDTPITPISPITPATSTPLEAAPLTGSTPDVIIPATSSAKIIEDLLKFADSKTYQMSDNSELPSFLQGALQEIQQNPIDGILRIIFTDPNASQVDFSGFLQGFNLATPDNAKGLFSEQVNLFVAKNSSLIRFGLIVKINDAAGLRTALMAWETQIENDWAGLWSVLGKTSPAVVRYFRQANYQGLSFRYQTFTKQDFGICYLITDQYFILTTSYGGMKMIIDNLQNQ